MLTSSPEDYGLTKDETLAFEVTAAPAPRFDAYWREFREEVASLSTRWQGAIDGAVNEVIIPSMRSVRVAGRITLPGDSPRGLVVRLHGSGAADGFEEIDPAWTQRGLAVLQLRVRGYPPSTIDIDDLRSGWILHDLEDAEAWIARGAVADIMQAYRCARVHFGSALPIALHGESLGGGLGVLAAAQLIETERESGSRAGVANLTPERLVTALPSFGAWRWRRGRYCNGTGSLVNEALTALRQDEDRVMDTLLLFDAAIHARFVTSPALCKLAARDDVVPAPSAAAVFNALASPRKWRYVVEFGHYDGGITDMRRHVRFERALPAFCDPDADPAGAAALLADAPRS